jgi:PAS domain-containing protein
MSGLLENRILIIAPLGHDAEAIASTLVLANIAAQTCATPSGCLERMREGAGALLLTEEALELPGAPELLDSLRTQPAWSQLPVIILTSGGESRFMGLLDLAASAAGSVTLLERPMSAATLVRSVQVALTSRGRQYQLRDLLAEQQRQHEKLRASEERYRTLFESIDEGFCTIEVLFDGDLKAVDYRFLVVNPAFERQTGIQNAVGRRIRELVPLHEEHWFRIFGQVALSGEPIRFENPAAQLHRYYDVYAFRLGNPEDHHVGVLFNDISPRKRPRPCWRATKRSWSNWWRSARPGSRSW